MKHPLLSKNKILEFPKQQRLHNRPQLSELFGSLEELSKSKRNEMIRTAVIEYGYPQIELSKHLGLHYSTISRLLK